MRVTANSGSAENTAINDGRVVEAIGEDRISPPGKGGNHPHIGHIAGGEEERGTALGEGSQALFQAMVGIVMTTNQVRRCATQTSLRQGINKGVKIRGMIRQAQVIVTAE